MKRRTALLTLSLAMFATGAAFAGQPAKVAAAPAKATASVTKAKKVEATKAVKVEKNAERKA